MNAASNSNPTLQNVYLILGSNIRPERFIPLGLEELGKRFEILGASSVWKTPAEGFVGADFLNAAVHVQTNLTSISLKYRVLRPLEAQLGRVRTEHKYSPRTIDIDILIFGEEIMDHEIWQQPHLAVPLAELLPNLVDPGSGVSIKDRADELIRSTPMQQVPGFFSEFRP